MQPNGPDTSNSVIRRLRELIAALDRRTPRPERLAESQIAVESSALREAAVDRIAQLGIRNQSPETMAVLSAVAQPSEVRHPSTA